MTLQEFFRALWLSRWLVLIALVATMLGAWYYLSEREIVYHAEARVQAVDTDLISSSGIRLDADPRLASSDRVAAAAAESLGAPQRAEEIAEGIVAEYSLDEMNTVALVFTGSSAEDAVEVVNAVAAAYVADLQTQFDQGVEVLQARLEVLGESIEESQATINADRLATVDPDALGPVVPLADGLLEAQYSAQLAEYQNLLGLIAEAQVLAEPATVRQNATAAQLGSIPDVLILFIALLGGLLLGVALAVGRRAIDTKVRTSGGAGRLAGAPVLAKLYSVDAAQRSYRDTSALPVADRSATPFTQSVRELRTAVQATVDTETPAGVVVVVTAADSEAPRSFLAANLAASWALSGRTVVALSGDLRQPRLNAFLPPAPTTDRPPTKKGAAADRQPGGSGVVQTAVPHLSVYPSLETELDPADFLATDTVRSLLQDLRSVADVVIVDAPPMLVAADATILGGLSDGVLLAARLHHTRVGALEESADRLRAANARLLGVVVDGGEGSKASYVATYSFTGGEAVEPAVQDAAAETVPDDQAKAPALTEQR